MSHVIALFTDESPSGKPLLSEAITAQALKVLTELVPFRVNSSSVTFFSSEKISSALIGSHKFVVIPRSRMLPADLSVERPYGTLSYATKDKTSPSISLKSRNQIPTCLYAQAWPMDEDENLEFRREPLEFNLNQAGDTIFISRWDDALDVEKLRTIPNIWTAGVTTWKKLVSKGIFVTGCTDGLGIQELHYLPECIRPQQMTIISHQEAPQRAGYKTLAAYRLVAESAPTDLTDKTHYFWKSGSLYRAMSALFPGVKNGFHACGPGETYDILKEEIPEDRIQIFLSFEDWKKEIVHAAEAVTEKQIFQTYP